MKFSENEEKGTPSITAETYDFFCGRGPLITPGQCGDGVPSTLNKNKNEGSSPDIAQSGTDFSENKKLFEITKGKYMNFEKIYRKSLKEASKDYAYIIEAYSEIKGQDRQYADRKDDILEEVHSCLRRGFDDKICIIRTEFYDDFIQGDF